MAQPHADAVPFQPTIPTHPKGTWDVGASWLFNPARHSIHRIEQASSVEQAQAQAAVEAVVLLHGIRRILLWTAVVVPAVLLVVGVVLAVSLSGSSSGF